MKRIDTPNRELDLFGAGKDGFRNGNLALGLQPTEFNADWPNGIQEELLAVIEAAGLAPDGEALNQILLALRAAGVFTTKAVNANTTEAATTEFVRNELLALGTSPYNAVFGRTLATSGYQRLPGGLLLQWGVVTSNAIGDTAVTFPIAFPNAALKMFLGAISSGDGRFARSLGVMTTTGTNIRQQTNLSAQACDWLALGH